LMQIVTPLIPPGTAGAIHYLAVCAYPSEPEDRDRFVAAALKLVGTASGLKRREPPAPARELKGSPQRAADIFRSGERRIRAERTAAAYAAIRRIESTPTNPVTVEAALANWWGLPWRTVPTKPGRDTEGPIQPPHVDHLKQRIWHPSAPVLPMVLSLTYTPEALSALLSRKRNGAGAADFRAFDGALTIDSGPSDWPSARPSADTLSDPSWLPGAIAASRDLAAPLTAHLLRDGDDIYIPRLSY